jgi:CDP-diacylglycerol pyrophosphatase
MLYRSSGGSAWAENAPAPGLSLQCRIILAEVFPGFARSLVSRPEMKPELRFRAPLLCVAWLALQGCASPATPAGPSHSNALWVVVDTGCNQGWAPIPALQCFPKRGDAVLKDRCGATHFLLIPLARRSGVESPELLSGDEPDYFEDAWSARDRVISASGRSDVRSDELGLAVNSRWGRSQDQLHIHIDFVRPEVRAALAQWSREGGTRPEVELFGHRYRVFHVTALIRPTPFQRAATPGESERERGKSTIAVVGDGGAGFYELFGRADLTGLDRGHAEEILVSKPCGK